jgi:hypothetical protein
MRVLAFQRRLGPLLVFAGMISILLWCCAYLGGAPGGQLPQGKAAESDVCSPVIEDWSVLSAEEQAAVDDLKKLGEVSVEDKDLES